MLDYFRQSTENRSICSYYTTPQASDTEQIPNSYLSGDIEGDFRTTRLPSRLSTRGEADRERLFRSPFDLVFNWIVGSCQVAFLTCCKQSQVVRKPVNANPRLVYVIARAQEQLGLISHVFSKFSQNCPCHKVTSQGNLENFKNTSEINP